jgi:hypothetical protein
MKHRRAYAASVALQDGTLWILGGAGSKDVLISTEFIALDTRRGVWRAKPGPDLPFPMMLHCAALIDKFRVLVTGGYILDGKKDDYTDRSWIYDFRYYVTRTLYVFGMPRPYHSVPQGEFLSNRPRN